MIKSDLLKTLSVAFITSVFLIPTLITTGLYKNLPIPLVLVFLVFPTISILGMCAIAILAKKLPILWQIAKFAQVGVANTAIDFGILNTLISVTGITSGVGIIAINAASFTGALVNSYFWNRTWVFKSGTKSNFLTFAIITLLGLSVNSGVVYVITTFIPPILVQSDTLWANIAKAFATGISMVWNFLGYKIIVFKPGQPTTKTLAP